MVGVAHTLLIVSSLLPCGPGDDLRLSSSALAVFTGPAMSLSLFKFIIIVYWRGGVAMVSHVEAKGQLCIVCFPFSFTWVPKSC